MNVSRQCRPDEPIMVEWAKFKKTDDYGNMLLTKNTSSAMWAAFNAGFHANKLERVFSLRRTIWRLYSLAMSATIWALAPAAWDAGLYACYALLCVAGGVFVEHICFAYMARNGVR